MCGDPRNTALDPDEAPYLKSDARPITDKAALAEANAGPEWNCGHCGTNNRGDTDTCSECGRAKDYDDRVAAVSTYVEGVDAQDVEVSDPSQRERDWVDATLQSSDPLQELEDGPVAQPHRTYAIRDIPRSFRGMASSVNAVVVDRTSLKLSSIVGTIVALMVVVLGGSVIYTNFIRVQDVELTVASLSWERGVEVEQFRTLSKSDWTYPSDARVIGSRQEIHHYNQVQDGYETKTRQVPETRQTGTRSESYVCGSTTVDNGNGTFSSRSTYCDRQVPVYTTTYRSETYQVPVYKSVPVYKTKYDFQVDRWVTDHFDRDSGEMYPFWPKPDVPATCPARPRLGDKCVGDEREETYTVVLADKEGRTFDREVGLTTWSYLSEDEIVPAKQTRRGSVRGVSWPTS